ncbi:MAG TPA: ATP-binding protein [Spirochaetales bacterium]|nr:ATP-binding protein [Spirochaetales bacterium]HRZ63971.1 ATP-binding protein [Spirochaetia bacterium]
MIETVAELCRIFAQDATEKAYAQVAGVLKRFFEAETAALFYVNGRKEFSFCLAGTEFPIGLPEARWREGVGPVRSAPEVSRFGPWTLPGFESPLEHWMSSELHAAEGHLSFVLLGRSARTWAAGEGSALSSIARTLTPIIDVRIEREREEFVRRQVEKNLAESERRLRAFFEDSRDMIYTANAEDVVTSMNAAGFALTGRSERHEILGHPFSDLALNPEDREHFLGRIRSEGFASDYEIVLRRKDGGTVFALETAHALKDAEGRIVEVQGIIKDISERIMSERELWKANLELAEANRKLQQTQMIMIQHEKLASIGQLAAGIAHEINNPVGFLKSNNSFLERAAGKVVQAWGEAKAAAGPLVAEIEEKYDLAYTFSQLDSLFAGSNDGFSRITSIVSNLKRFSYIDASGQFDFYDVNAGIENSLVVAWNEIKYVAEIRKSLGELPKIKALGGEINQVILNLLVNAAQAIESQKRPEKGLIEIATSLRRAEGGAGGDRVVIEIGDDGPGIPEPIRLRIFDPFFTTKEPGKGTGLGLSISYDIVVSKHGGSLTVESSPGEGATFVIELPVAGPSGPRAAEPGP